MAFHWGTESKMGVADDIGWTVCDNVLTTETRITQTTHSIQLKG